MFAEIKGAAEEGAGIEPTSEVRGARNETSVQIKVALWEWNFDADKNPNAETFVNVDHTQILQHTAYVGGLCLRQRIAGPLGQRFLADSKSKASYASVPEFAAFWSETPFSTWLPRTSAKVFLLVLTSGFIYMACQPGPIFLFARTQQLWSAVSIHGAVMDVKTDPFIHIEPLIFNSIGGMRIESSSLPLGYINRALLPFGFLMGRQIISNYCVIPPTNTTHSWQVEPKTPTLRNTRTLWSDSAKYPPLCFFAEQDSKRKVSVTAVVGLPKHSKFWECQRQNLDNGEQFGKQGHYHLKNEGKVSTYPPNFSDFFDPT